MRRRVPLVGVLAAVALAAGCTSPGPGWVGGPVTPSPVPVTFNPSAPPVGTTMPTTIVVEGREMVLYLWGTQPTLDIAWRDPATGTVTDGARSMHWQEAFCAPYDHAFLALYELSDPDGTIADFGAVRAPAARVVDQFDGGTVEAAFTRWTADPSVTVFWLRRGGSPIPHNSPLGGDRDTPLAPELYPLITVYDVQGHPVAASRVRPPATGPKTY
jgi:hypothetical protein